MARGFTEFYVGARTAPLGLRFWDPIASAFVGDGLRVVAYPAVDPSRRVEAIANASRVWVFHKLAGMGAVERGEGDAAFWASPPKARAFVIDVDDMLAVPRFQPFQMTLSAPVREPFAWAPPVGVTLPAMPPGAVPLFSAATRTVPQGMAVIRAELWDPNAATPAGFKGPGGPAAWAVLTAKVGGALVGNAIADASGRAAVMFPYPAPVGAGADGLTAVRLTEQTWPVELSVQYAPAGKPGARAVLPEVLTQAAGTLWEKWDDANPAGRKKLAAATLTLAYGEELVAKTAGGGQAAVLYVTAP
jgi:hypothetical protein